MEQIIKIATFILDSFVHIWPYLLISIPLAVLVQVSGAAKFINKALGKKPIVAILLATIVGALSPFCSCGVIPVIATLLISGVPLAPVMSFWIASPSMDPEIFFLSVATVGWELSVWRLVSTFIISLSSGYITHWAVVKEFIGKDILRKKQVVPVSSTWRLVRTKTLEGIKFLIKSMRPVQMSPANLMIVKGQIDSSEVNCCVSTDQLQINLKPDRKEPEKPCTTCSNVKKPKPSFRKKLLHETWTATIMVVKFMALAFFINALITFYVPQEFISNLLGGNGAFSAVIAALVGIPTYTSNLTALPLISGLITLGMNKGAALAFLIAGPTTTLPAMVAVWGITKKKVFFLYLSFSLIGAIAFGLLYNLF